MAALEVGVGAEIVTVPLLLAGLGIGALASQLGAVTVSAVPDEQSGEVGGIQNTFTNLGASIGTALAGAVLISALTTSFFTGIDENEAIPPSVTAQAQVELSSGIPFVSDAQLETALAEADVDPAVASAIVDENTQSRLDGLRSALAVLALLALVAFFTSGGLPTRQPGSPEPGTAADPAPNRGPRRRPPPTGRRSRDRPRGQPTWRALTRHLPSCPTRRTATARTRGPSRTTTAASATPSAGSQTRTRTTCSRGRVRGARPSATRRATRALRRATTA